MKYIFPIITAFALLPNIAHAQKSNPFASIGKKAEVHTLSNGKYTETYDDDVLQRVGTVVIDRRTKKIVRLLDSDSVNSELSDNSTASRWYSIDPKADQRVSVSPYNFCQNNPIIRVDPNGALDEVVIRGSEAQAAVTELQSSVGTELTLSRNSNTGQLTYTQTNPATPLSANAQQLANAINDPNITVNVSAENTKQTSAGNLYVGGAFMGNTVTQQNGVTKVSTSQEINPNVLSAADNYYGTSGSLTLHEVTESYQGALISQQAGVSAAPATNADSGNPNSVYMRAHNAATPQNMQVFRNVYDAQGNVLQPPYTGGTRIEYSVQQGSRPAQVIMTYP